MRLPTSVRNVLALLAAVGTVIAGAISLASARPAALAAPAVHSIPPVLLPDGTPVNLISLHADGRTEEIMRIERPTRAGRRIAVRYLTAGAPAAARPPRPDMPMLALTVTATDLSGRPDNGDTAWVYNLDNLALISGPAFNQSTFYQGVAKFSVPAGHYVVISDFGSFDRTGNSVTRLVVAPHVTVRQNTTIHVAEQEASSQVTMTTPRPAIAQDVSLTVVFRDRHRDTVGLEVTSAPGSVWVSPTSRKPAAGAMQAFASAQLTSPAQAAGIPYAYNLDFKDPAGIIPVQRYQVKPSSLATVTERYYQDAASVGAWATAGAYLDEDQAAGGAEGGGPPAFVLGPLALPGSQVQYFSAAPDLYWDSWYYMSAAQGNGGQFDQALRVLSPGEKLVTDWNRYPLHAGTAFSTGIAGGLDPIIPSATIAGNTLRLLVSPFSDDEPGHVGFTPATTVRYEIDENGTRIGQGNGLNGIPPVTVRKIPSAIRFSLDAAGPAYQRWTRTSTTWTWRSVRRRGATVPPSWFCSQMFQPVDRLLRRCTVQPMLTLDYRVRRLSLDGLAPAGRQLIDVHAGPIQLAPATRITKTTANVSCDDGKTWKPVTVTRAGGGNFRLAFSAPAGCAVTLRVAAADRTGGSIDETIVRAYRIASPPAVRAACPPVRRGFMRCFALYLRPSLARPAVPSGWGARDIESAYRLPVARESHQTVAVIDAFSTPGLASSLAVYRHRYGLPACTTASGCLRIVNQQGKPSPLPGSGAGTGWDVETMIDVSMVSAACPHCSILVVQASSPADADLAAAQDTAAKLGAQVISDSFGSAEWGGAQAYAPDYDHPGHQIVVSSGDNGFAAANFPANQRAVTAVGGTQLTRAPNARGWSERVWDVAQAGASGSGCSAWVAKPSWQRDPHCPGRTVADVSAVAWHVAVYDHSEGGWLSVGGTSVSAPLIAGIYGLAGNAAKIKPGSEYRHPKSLFDITVGNNDLLNGTGGATCGHDYLCTAKKAYDAPTGLGTPNGIGAF